MDHLQGRWTFQRWRWNLGLVVTVYMNPLITYLRKHIPDIDPDVLNNISSIITKESVSKGDFLLKQGDTCKHLYFNESGIIRCFSLIDGIDITTWFSFKNEFITSFTSFFPKVPSYENMELLTDATLLKISFSDFDTLRRQSIEFERVINHFITLYTIQIEKRLFQIQTQSAIEKYQTMLRSEPHLIQKIPSKHLASYLGVTRETLSRIRSSIN